MNNVRIQVDKGGWAKFLNSAPVHDLIEGKAEAVASAVRSQNPTAGGKPIPVLVRDDSIDPGSKSYGDRVRYSVVLDHIAGKRAQAKHGYLTRALSAARGGN